MFAGLKDDCFASAIPDRPMGRYAHLVVLRQTESYSIFQTDGELNTARVPAGLTQPEPLTRVVLFKRKQTTPERLTGRALLRRYGIIGDQCDYNEKFCGVCPDCILYGYAIGETGSEKSKVIADTAFSLTAYDDSHETFTLNAPYEDGTMTRQGVTTPRFSEQDHVKPGVYFPSVVTLRDPTRLGLAYLMNNIRRTKHYGAQTTRTGRVHNEIVALVLADGEIFSNLRLTQAMWDRLAAQDQPRHPLAGEPVWQAAMESVRSLLQQDGVTYTLVEGPALMDLIRELDATCTHETDLGAFLKALDTETRAYAERVGGSGKKGRKQAGV